MKIKKYYSIGEMAGLSNTSVKNIRYYSDLGILQPAYTNPENGYRYYKYEQLVEITLIQFCLTMNVPLKTYKNYLDGSTLDYQTFLEYCHIQAKQKLLEAERNVAYIENSKYSIDLLNQYGIDTVYQRFSPNRVLVALPCEYPYASQKFMDQLQILQQALLDAGYVDLFDWGSLEHQHHGVCEPYIYYEIYNADSLPDHLSAFVIHSGHYESIIKHHSTDMYTSYFQDLQINPTEDCLIINHTICTAQIHFDDPIIEIQCIHQHGFLHQSTQALA